jgi:hypothetical protein
LPIRCAETQEYSSIAEASADFVGIVVCDLVHDRSPRILPDRSDRGHVCWFTLVPFHLKFTAQTLQNFTLPSLEQIAKMFVAYIPEERHQFPECLI